jgi:hypothetical protein
MSFLEFNFLSAASLEFLERRNPYIHKVSIRNLLSSTLSLTTLQESFTRISMSGQQSKADRIAEEQANLPLPEDPPVASDVRHTSSY